jgi:hypothetical protein
MQDDSSHSRSQAGLDHGIRVAAACNGVLLVWLYAVAAPTKDIRARIPFLLGFFSGTGWLGLALVFAVAGLIGLAIAGGWSRGALIGVAIGAVVSLLVLQSGIVGALIPAGYENGPSYILLATAVLVAGLTLWHARRGLRGREPGL